MCRSRISRRCTLLLSRPRQRPNALDWVSVVNVDIADPTSMLCGEFWAVERVCTVQMAAEEVLGFEEISAVKAEFLQREGWLDTRLRHDAPPRRFHLNFGLSCKLTGSFGHYIPADHGYASLDSRIRFYQSAGVDIVQPSPRLQVLLSPWCLDAYAGNRKREVQSREW